jgi:hypothetical protein
MCEFVVVRRKRWVRFLTKEGGGEGNGKKREYIWCHGYQTTNTYGGI